MPGGMRQRIAMALCERHSVGGRWQDWLPDADAVLDALAEPTEEMLEAVVAEPTHLYGQDGRGEEYRAQMKAAVQVERLLARQRWQDLLTAAKEK